MLDALQGAGIAAHGRSGLNVWIPVADEGEVVHALLSAGFYVRPGSRYRLETPPAIRVTISQLMPTDARRFAQTLRGILRSSHAARGP